MKLSCTYTTSPIMESWECQIRRCFRATVNSLTAEEDAEGAAGRCPRVNFHLSLFLSRAYNRLLRHQGIILWKRIENPQLPFFKLQAPTCSDCCRPRSAVSRRMMERSQ